MKKIAIFLTALMLASIAVHADDDINYSFSTKIWNTTIRNNGSPATQSANAPIISGTIKKSDYFLIGNYLLPASYTEGTDYTTRHDIDLAAGWSFSSNFSLLAGQKQIVANKFDFNGCASCETVNISYLGLNGFAAVTNKHYFYGTVTKSFKATDKTPTGDTSIKFTTYEGGYGYVMNKNTQLSIGYRYQRFDVTGSGGANIPGVIVGVTLIP